MSLSARTRTRCPTPWKPIWNGWSNSIRTTLLANVASRLYGERGPRHKLVGFALRDSGMAEGGQAVVVNGQPAGRVASAALQPDCRQMCRPWPGCRLRWRAAQVRFRSASTERMPRPMSLTMPSTTLKESASGARNGSDTPYPTFRRCLPFHLAEASMIEDHGWQCADSYGSVEAEVRAIREQVGAQRYQSAGQARYSRQRRVRLARTKALAWAFT